MNTKKTPRKRKLSLTDALAKGALVWGPVYSIGTSTATYWVSRLATGSAPAFGDLVVDTLMIFPLLSMVSGAITWRVANHNPGHKTRRNKRNKRNRSNRFSSGSRLLGMRPKHA